jgi:hypothetical protein
MTWCPSAARHGRSVPYADGMAKGKKKPGDANMPHGSEAGPPGKKQRSKARKSSKSRSR